MYAKYIPSHYFTYSTFCISYISSVNCIKFLVVCYTAYKSFIDELCFGTTSKLWNFEFQKVVKFYVYLSPVLSCGSHFAYKPCMHGACLASYNCFCLGSQYACECVCMCVCVCVCMCVCVLPHPLSNYVVEWCGRYGPHRIG